MRHQLKTFGKRFISNILNINLGTNLISIMVMSGELFAECGSFLYLLNCVEMLFRLCLDKLARKPRKICKPPKYTEKAHVLSLVQTICLASIQSGGQND